MPEFEVLLDLPRLATLVRFTTQDDAQVYELVLAESVPAGVRAEAQQMIPTGHNWLEIDEVGDFLLGVPATLFAFHDRADWTSGR
jgi:hypothetical protein